MPETLTFAFYEYPSDCGRARHAMVHVDRLVQHIQTEYGIGLDLNLVEGRESFPEYTSLLQELLAECESQDRELDIFWVHFLPMIANHPEQTRIAWVRGHPHFTDQFPYGPIEPWVQRLVEEAHRWQKPPLQQFITIKDRPWRRQEQGGPWGAELPPGSYGDLTTAVERSGFPLAIYHAFLHLLRVDDGYDPLSTMTFPGCESCWMQYNPTLGSGLCDLHQRELRSYVAEG